MEHKVLYKSLHRNLYEYGKSRQSGDKTDHNEEPSSVDWLNDKITTPYDGLLPEEVVPLGAV